MSECDQDLNSQLCGGEPEQVVLTPGYSMGGMMGIGHFHRSIRILNSKNSIPGV